MCAALHTKILTRSFSPISCYLESIFQMTFFCIFFSSLANIYLILWYL